MVNVPDVLITIQYKDLFPVTSGALIFFKTCFFSSAEFLKPTRSWLHGPFLQLQRLLLQGMPNMLSKQQQTKKNSRAVLDCD